MAAAPNISDARRYAFLRLLLGLDAAAGKFATRHSPRNRHAFPRRLQELCGYSVYKGQFGHIDNHDPIELWPRAGKRMVWEATDAKKARTAGSNLSRHGRACPGHPRLSCRAVLRRGCPGQARA
jgi:hypothetical protein